VIGQFFLTSRTFFLAQEFPHAARFFLTHLFFLVLKEKNHVPRKNILLQKKNILATSPDTSFWAETHQRPMKSLTKK